MTSRQQIDSQSRFEIKALAFRKMTGGWPMGWDWPPALGPRDEKRDELLWKAWVGEYQKVIDAMFSSIEELHEHGFEIF